MTEEKVVLVYDIDSNVHLISHSYQGAVKELIRQGLIDEETEVRVKTDFHSYSWKPIKWALGSKWDVALVDFYTIRNFNNLFDGILFMEERTIID